jgi:hypothetical protein
MFDSGGSPFSCLRKPALCKASGRDLLGRPDVG